MQKTKSNIGLLAIVKNEENNISRMLDSVKHLVDQIVIIDTGSVDTTPQICSKYGAEVHFLSWKDDFSLARNYGLKAMRTDWIISLDADEELDAKSFVNEISIIDDENLGGLNCEIINYLNDGQQKSRHRYTRIFRNHPEIKYSGKIHEQIRESIESAGFKIADTSIKIKHFGYTEISEEKQERNRELLEKEIEGNSNDDWLKYHLANTEFSLNKMEEAGRIFKEIYQSEQLTETQKEMSRLRLGQIALSKEEYDALENYLSFVSNDVNREGLRKFILAAMYMLKHEFTYAKSYYSSQEVMQSELVEQTTVEQALSLLNQLGGADGQ